MTAATASLVPATTAVSSLGRTRKSTNKVVQVRALSYQGLSTHNSIASMGMPVNSDQAFVEFITALRAPVKGRKRGAGGGLGAQCNAVGEIFRIAAIMNGLTLVGVAVGFVLLRIEAFVEESEE